jgi:Leucine-rich repeat (LRR) protein
MKITKSDLKQIIKEEVVKLLVEQDEYDDYEEEELTPAQKIIRFLSSPDPDTFAQGVEIYSLVKDDIEANAPTENSQILEKLEVIDQFADSDIKEKNVNFLSGLRELNVTQKIILKGCRSLKNVDGLKGLKSPENVDALQRFTSLTKLDLSYCGSLQNVDGLEGCTNLTTLYLTGCSSLKNVDVLKGCTNLTTLDLNGCESLQNVDGLKECTNLTSLDLSYCRSLVNVDGLKGCTNLTSLSLFGCESLQNVDGLEGCTNLANLDLYECESLQNVDGLEGCTNLISLSLEECKSLPIKLQKYFGTDSSGTAHEKFMEALNASKTSQP